MNVCYLSTFFFVGFSRNLMAKQDMSELGFGKEYGIEAPHGKNEEIDEKPAA